MSLTVNLDINNRPMINSENNITVTGPRTIFGKKRGDGTAHVNGVIEHFEQGETSTDCVALAQLIGLSFTPIGRQAIKDSVRPDGMGGAIVTFEGAKGNQKEFRISVEEFNKYGNYKIYTKGDDDVLCIELAMVKYLKSQGYYMSDKDWRLNFYSIEELSEHGLIGLLLGDDKVVRYRMVRDLKDTERCLAEFERNPENYAVWFSFNRYYEGRFDGNDDSDDVHSGHAYALKDIRNINGEKYVIFIDPFNSTKEKKMKYSDFIFYKTDEIKMYAIGTNEINRDIIPLGARTFEKNQNDEVEAGMNEFKYRGHLGQVRFLYTRYQEFAEMADFASDDELKQYINNLSDLERYFIMKNSANIFIDRLDHRYRGWNSESMQNKKEVIEPFIDSVIEHARLYGVSDADINNFRNTCTQELDNKFYTRESKIIGAFNAFVSIVEAAKEEYYQGCVSTWGTTLEHFIR